MEDTIEQVKSSVNQVLLMRPGDLQESVNEWLDSISTLTDFLDVFVGPLLEVVSCPRNKDVFSGAGRRVEELVAGIGDVATDLNLAVQYVS